MSLDIAFPQMKSPQLLSTLDWARQLRSLESLSPQQITALQHRQLTKLLQHAAHSPFWQQRFKQHGLHEPFEQVDAGAFSALAHLTRNELQDQFEQLRSWPGQFKEDEISLEATSGSSGQPVRVEKLYALHTLLYSALLLVEMAWHQFNLNKPFGFYRHRTKDSDQAIHGFPFRELGLAGVGYSRSVFSHTIDTLYEPLRQFEPAQVSGSPTLIRLLCEHALQQPLAHRPHVNVFNTFGEGVPQSLRHLVHEAFGSKLVDRYSCGEIGLIALQCPKHDHYHVMSGTVLLEIVDEAGLPCPIGQPGHVLVTGLQSYAMPIIRYELGDIAQWGPPCDCGIGLPVIEKILGKTRDFVLHPNGHKHFVSLGGAFAHDVTALQIYEVVFYTNSIIEFTYTARAELSLMELESLEAQLQERFGHPWPVVFKRVVAIAHGGFRKRREFSKMDVPYMPAPDSMSTGRTHAS